jgi:hypothetical protein
VISQICKQIVSQSNKQNLAKHQLVAQHKQMIYDQTADFPSKISLSKRILALAKQCDCACKQCGIVHGDYWHSPAVANPLREKLRDQMIRDQNHTVMHVKEYEYIQNKQQVIEQCINFLIK